MQFGSEAILSISARTPLGMPTNVHDPSLSPRLEFSCKMENPGFNTPNDKSMRRARYRVSFALFIALRGSCVVFSQTFSLGDHSM